jgi:antitoxin (DNA-binding transcriptional repressor) of toxin-antitoxin stability system
MIENNELTACVDVRQAKARLSQLLGKVVAGSTIVMCKAGKPVVRAKKLGLLKGRIRVPDDFDGPLPPESLVDSTY